MLSLIRLAQRWLRPGEAETTVGAQDSSSMADLVRLLEVEPSEPAGSDGVEDTNSADPPVS